MVKSTIIQVSPKELAKLISEQLREDIQLFQTNPKVKELETNQKPHLTKLETSIFFDVSLNSINNWSKKGILKPIKIGQRIYFKKSDLLDLIYIESKE